MAADTLMAERNQEDNSGKLHCPYAPEAAVTGHRNKTIILQVFPLSTAIVYACASVRF